MFSKTKVNRTCSSAYSFFRLFIIGLIIFAVNAPNIEAQSTIQWEPDQRVPGYSDGTFYTPFLVADQNRTVHVFAVQTASYEDRTQIIVYRQWNQDKGWTIPVDILYFPSGDAQIIGAFLDSKGIIHLAYYGGEVNGTNIYYTNAYASRANDVSAWSSPLVIGEEPIGPCFGEIMGDDKGNMIILYNGKADGNGVYAVTSNDAGYSWSNPTPIFLTRDDQLVPFTIKGYMGKSGKLHVVWNILNPANEFVSLYYGRLDVDNNQWDKPVLLEKKPEIKEFFGPATPFIVDNGKYVVIMYNGGSPYTGQQVAYGRPTLRVQISTDNGESWEVAENPFPLLTGSSGEHSLVIDSNQNVHAIALMRIDGVVNGEYHAIGGMWHSELRDNVWSNPERFVTSVRSRSVKSVVSQGNVLLAIWIAESVTGEGVWYSYTVLDSPELPIVALPTPPRQSPLKPTSSIPSPDASLTQENKLLLIDQGATAYTPAQPLVYGIIPAILLILGTIFAVWLRDRHKS